MKRHSLFPSVLFLLLFTVPAPAQDGPGGFMVDLVVGSVMVSHDNGAGWGKADADMELKEGDMVKTGAQSYCEISLPDGHGSIRVMESSVFRVKTAGTNMTVRQDKGKSLFDITRPFGPGGGFNVESDSAVACVRGTEFVIEADEENAVCTVVRGRVELVRNIDLSDLAGLTESVRNELAENYRETVGDGQEMHVTKTENRQFLETVRRLKGNPDELKKVMREKMFHLRQKLNRIQNREWLDKMLSNHQEERRKLEEKIRERTRRLKDEIQNKIKDKMDDLKDRLDRKKR